MADFGTKISELPAADALTGTELLPGVQGGQTKRATAAQIATLAKNGLTKEDVGLGNVANERQYSADNPPPAPTPAEIGAVPSTRTVNGKALSADIVLDAEDIGIEVDAAPTEDSTNLVESGGVYAAILALLPTDTASGNPANFPDGADDAPVVDLTAEIALTQPGSGLPSQSNVRPISTFTGLTLSHSGADTSDPEELAISWEDEAGAIIAGTLDITTGVLSITHVDYSTEAWANSYTTGSTSSTYVQAAFTPRNQGLTLGYVWSDRFSSEYASGVVNKMAFITSGNAKRAFFNIPISELSDTTTEAVQAWLAAEHVQFVFKYDTPVTVQLTPHEVKTLLGENNLWADTGAVTVTYRANISDYITKKLPSTMSPLSMSRPALILGAVEPQSLGLDEGETASAEAEAEND